MRKSFRKSKFLGYYDEFTLRDIFQYCFQADLDKGGIFDARSGIVHIYSRSWNTPLDVSLSKLVGSFSVNWSTKAVDIQEESSQPLAERLFQYLMKLAVARSLPPAPMHRPDVAYRLELQEAERELAQMELEK